MVFVLPPTEILTLRMLGFQHLLVLRWEWETFSPNTTPLPQTLHFAIFDTSLNTVLYAVHKLTSRDNLHNTRHYTIHLTKKQEFF